jgi:preprotein translocase subunit YajC
MLPMDSFILPLLMAGQQAAGSAEQGGGSVFATFVPFLLIIAIFYLLIIRPQNKKRKETEAMLKSLKKGDKIVTIGGLYGVVTKVKDSTVVIKVDNNVELEFLRSAVSSVREAAPVKEEKEKEIEDKAEEVEEESGEDNSSETQDEEEKSAASGDGEKE